MAVLTDHLTCPIYRATPTVRAGVTLKNGQAEAEVRAFFGFAHT